MHVQSMSSDIELCNTSTATPTTSMTLLVILEAQIIPIEYTQFF
jgi:hypothetical protein